uniref:Uncharacterized protein n=1 Tax=Rhizophora mucronata TaxID=61149 RepID=A0A2P2PHF5_RHIMU
MIQNLIVLTWALVYASKDRLAVIPSLSLYSCVPVLILFTSHIMVKECIAQFVK